MADKVLNISEATVHKFVESLRPEDLEIRKQLDMGYSYDGKSFILYAIRPYFMDPEDIMHLEFAKMRYYKSRGEWNLYWMRASGKWELYRPFPEARRLEEILETIKQDSYGCFFG